MVDEVCAATRVQDICVQCVCYHLLHICKFLKSKQLHFLYKRSQFFSKIRSTAGNEVEQGYNKNSRRDMVRKNGEKHVHSLNDKMQKECKI